LISGSAGVLISSTRGDLERVLLDARGIERRPDELAVQIANDYRDRELMVIAVLIGSLMFIAHLLRRILLPLKFDCVSVASYQGKARSSGQVVFKPRKLWGPDVAGRDVLILDDILDTRCTLAAICEKLETAKPRSFKIRVLLRKKKPRARQVAVDCVGFEIEDEFVIGYGLDFMERYRNLPYIGVLRKELLEQMS
jgi:hypoxanthine phosphoribosyltransferase